MPNTRKACDPRFFGKTGIRTSTGRCSECGASGFSYAGYSKDGVRGYRCMTCGTIKPEVKTVSIDPNNPSWD